MHTYMKEKRKKVSEEECLTVQRRLVQSSRHTNKKLVFSLNIQTQFNDRIRNVFTPAMMSTSQKRCVDAALDNERVSSVSSRRFSG